MKSTKPLYFFLTIGCLTLPGRTEGRDCNTNGVDDTVDISNGVSRDCDSNGVPDECDIAGGGRSFAPGVFHAPGGIIGASGRKSVATGDFDGDNDLDIATEGWDSVGLYENDGTGTMRQDARVVLPAGLGSGFVAAADLDGDHHPDIARANGLDGSISVMLNLGDWKFTSQIKYSVGTEPVGIGCADLDGDGDLDLAVANNKSNSVTLLENQGGGSFATRTTLNTPAADSGPVSLVMLDLDGHSEIDVAVANYGAKNVSIFKNQGGWSFSAPDNYPVGIGSDPRGEPNLLTYGDFDGDGDPDLATANWTSSTMSVLTNNGDGTLAERVNYPADAKTASVAAADFDGDGDLDLAVGSEFQPPYLHTFRNDGTGVFLRDDECVGGRTDGCYFFVAADLDRDGFPDLASASRSSSGVSLYFTRFAKDRDSDGLLDACGAPRRGDANEDGVFDLSDLMMILEWGCCGTRPPPCNQIFDLDGLEGFSISDSVFAVRFLFLGAVPPPAMTCQEALRCEDYRVQDPPSLAAIGYGFEGVPLELTGLPGQIKTFEFFSTLRTDQNSTSRGAQGWSLGIAVNGGRITEASLEGIELSIQGDSLASSDVPLDTQQPFFKDASLSTDGGATTVICLELNNHRIVTLSPSGTQRVCRFIVEAKIPEDGSTANLTLEYKDGLRGKGQPVRNVVSFQGVPQIPTLGQATVALRVQTGGSQLPADCNQDGTLDISDAICLLGHLFLGTPARVPCDGGTIQDAGNISLLDSNGGGAVDLSDAVYLLGYLFGGSSPPVLGADCVSIAGCPDNSEKCSQ